VRTTGRSFNNALSLLTKRTSDACILRHLDTYQQASEEVIKDNLYDEPLLRRTVTLLTPH
jgi:hypothetical protein